MIVILTKCTCDHDRSPHKNIMFLSLYRIATIIVFFIEIATMITIFFIGTVAMIAVFTKMSYIWVFMRTTTIITVLKEDCDVAIFTKCPLIFCYSPHKMSYFWVSPHRRLWYHESQFSYQHRRHQQTPVYWQEWSLMLFHI